MWRPTILFALLALLACAGTAAAQPLDDGMDGPKATVELIVPTETVAPGSTVAVGVKFTMQPGWHIYWTNPGDAGEPPTFAWTLPGGGGARALRGGEWTATQPQFPTPIDFTEEAGVAGYGYSDSIIFPAEITVPANATPGQQAEVAVLAQYLICEDVCIPEVAQATASIAVGTPGEADAEIERDLASALERLPVAPESDRLVKSADVELVAGEPGLRRVSIEMGGPAQDVQLFPAPPTGMAIEDMSVETTGNQTVATFRVRAYGGAKVTASEFPLVVGYTAAGQRRGVTLGVPVGDAADE